MSENKKIVACYARVGRNSMEQSGRFKEGEALLSQIDRCGSFIAQKKEWQAGPIYMDIASTGDLERSGYQQMLKDAWSGKFHALVVTDFDRLTRNLSEGIRMVRTFTKGLGIKISLVARSRGKKNKC